MTTHSRGKKWDGSVKMKDISGLPRCPQCGILCADQVTLSIHQQGGCTRVCGVTA